MNVEQKNLPSYFNNLKRLRVEELDSKEDKIVKLKKEKKVVKLGENTFYTIQNFFNKSNEEDSIKKLKNEIKGLQITSNSNKDTKNSIQNYFKTDNKIDSNSQSSNVFNLVNPNKRNNIRSLNISYEDMRITNFIKIDSGFDFNGLNENMFFNIIKYMNFTDITRCSLVSKNMRKFYDRIIDSYDYFKTLDNTSYPEFLRIILKTKKLKHSKYLLELIRNDFGGNVKSMCNRIILNMGLTEKGDILKNGALFSHFSVSPRSNPQDNFFSNSSLDLLCKSSRFSLKGLALRSCLKLNNTLSNSITKCNFLSKLEISNNKY